MGESQEGKAGAEIRPDDFAFVYVDVDYFPIAWLAYRALLISPEDARAEGA